MNNLKLGILILSVLLAPLAGLADTTSKSGFIDEIKAALESKDGQKLASLYCYEGSPQKFKSDVKTQMPAMLAGLGGIKRVLYERHTEEPQPHVEDGALWGPNLRVLGIVAIYKEDGSKATLPYGKDAQGRYRLVGVKKIGEAATDGVVQLNYNGFGRTVSIRLNGKPVISNKPGGFKSITGAVKKGKNTLTISWKPAPGNEIDLSMLEGDVKVVHSGPSGQERSKKAIELKGPSGKATLSFEV